MRWIRKAVAFAYILAVFYPLALLLEGTPLSSAVLMAIAAGHVAVLLALEGLLRKRYHLIATLLVLGLGALESLLPPFGIRNLFLSIPLLLVGVAVVSAARQLGDQLMTFQRMCLVGSLFVAAAVAGYLFDRQDILPVAITGLGTYLLFGIVMVNVSATNDAAGRGGSPSALRGGNLTMAVAFALITALVVNIGVLRKWIGQAFAAMGDLYFWLAALLGEVAMSEPGGEMPSWEGMGPVEPGPETPAWLRLLQDILLWVLGVAAIALVVAGLGYLLVKTARRLYRFLREWFAQRTEQEEGYTDEQVSLINIGQIRANLAENLAHAVRRLTYRPPRWNTLDNRQKVRWAMEHLLFRRTKLTPDLTLTARETLAASPLPAELRRDFADAYERARYSSQDISDRDADDARKVADH